MLFKGAGRTGMSTRRRHHKYLWPGLYVAGKLPRLGHQFMVTAEKLDTLQAVELAEGVEIRLRVAGPMLRAGAYALDLLIRTGVMIVMGIAMGLLGIAIGERLGEGMLMLAWFLMEWFYPVLFEAGKRGATPGKRALGLRVVQATGSPISFGQAVVRNFLRWVDGMPFFTYGLGMASCLGPWSFMSVARTSRCWPRHRRSRRHPCRWV